MDELDAQMMLEEILTNEAEENQISGDSENIKSITSFATCGMLTSNKGLVIKMKDGSEFQVTIVQSKQSSR